MYFVQIYKTAENSKPLSAETNQMVRTHKRILEMYFCKSHRFGSESGFGSTGFWASRVRIRILLSSSKNSKKNLDSYCFVTSFGLFIFKKLCYCSFKR